MRHLSSAIQQLLYTPGCDEEEESEDDDGWDLLGFADGASLKNVLSLSVPHLHIVEQLLQHEETGTGKRAGKRVQRIKLICFGQLLTNGKYSVITFTSSVVEPSCGVFSWKHKRQ